MTYINSATYVLTRPRTLIHGAIGWLAFGLITLGYAYLAQGHPMYGADGAITVFVIRQGVALARSAVRFGVLAGQLELGKTRCAAAPTRRQGCEGVAGRRVRILLGRPTGADYLFSRCHLAAATAVARLRAAAPSARAARCAVDRVPRAISGAID